MKKPQLVKDWRQSWRWYSQQTNALLFSMGLTWAMIPADAKSPELIQWAGIAFGIVAALGAIGRVIDQDAPK
jgi:hypothetical protein